MRFTSSTVSKNVIRVWKIAFFIRKKPPYFLISESTSRELTKCCFSGIPSYKSHISSARKAAWLLTVLPVCRAGVQPANSTVASSRMANCMQKGNQMEEPHVASYCHLPLLQGLLTLWQHGRIRTTCLVMPNQTCYQRCAKRRRKGKKKKNLQTFLGKKWYDHRLQWLQIKQTYLQQTEKKKIQAENKKIRLLCSVLRNSNASKPSARQQKLSVGDKQNHKASNPI